MTTYCDIIIPIYNNRSCTEDCLRWLADNTAPGYRLILVDDASDEPTASWLRRITQEQAFGPTLLLRNPENLRWTGATNRGLEASDAPYICLLNNDTLPAPGWLDALIAHLEREPRMAFVTPQGNDNSVRKLAEGDIASFGMELARLHRGRYRRLSSVSGFCLVMRRRVYQDLGPFDPVYPQGHWADHDYCRRAQEKGMFAAEAQDSLVFHLETRTFGRFEPAWREKAREGEKIFIKRWGGKQGILWLPEQDLERPEAAGELLEVQALADRGADIYILPRHGESPESVRQAHGLPPHSNLHWLPVPLPRPLLGLWAAYQRKYLTHKKRVQNCWRGDAAGLAETLRRAAASPGAPVRAK